MLLANYKPNYSVFVKRFINLYLKYYISFWETVVSDGFRRALIGIMDTGAKDYWTLTLGPTALNASL